MSRLQESHFWTAQLRFTIHWSEASGEAAMPRWNLTLFYARRARIIVARVSDASLPATE